MLPKLNNKNLSLSPSVIKPHIFFPNHPICRPILLSSSHPLSSQSPSSFQSPTLRHPSRHQFSGIPHSTYRADILVPSLRSSSFDSSSSQALFNPLVIPRVQLFECGKVCNGGERGGGACVVGWMGEGDGDIREGGGGDGCVIWRWWR